MQYRYVFMSIQLEMDTNIVGWFKVDAVTHMVGPNSSAT